ncbi:hypothetical protein LINPERPRIM_LOCUS30764, partial [Linum perenne]
MGSGITDFRSQTSTPSFNWKNSNPIIGGDLSYRMKIENGYDDSRLDGKRSTQPLYVSFILYRFIMLHRVKKPTT